MAVTQDNVIPLHDRIVVRADEEEKVKTLFFKKIKRKSKVGKF